MKNYTIKLILIIILSCILSNVLVVYASQKIEAVDNLDIWKKQLSITKSNLDTAETLINDGIISQKEYQELKNKYLRAKENYEIVLSDKTKPVSSPSLNFNKKTTANLSNDNKLNKLKNNYESLLELYKSGIVSEKELIDAEIEYRASTITVNYDKNKPNISLTLPKLYNPMVMVLKTALKFITSTYGYRIHPISGIYSLHSGLDIAALKGTPVYAYADGIVSNNSSGLYSGTFVSIIHGNQFSSLYLHLDKSVVKSNQFVKKGQLIGYVGSTGFSTGSHLHFEIRKNNIPVNINNLIQRKPYLIVDNKHTKQYKK